MPVYGFLMMPRSRTICTHSTDNGTSSCRSLEPQSGCEIKLRRIAAIERQSSKENMLKMPGTTSESGKTEHVFFGPLNEAGAVAHGKRPAPGSEVSMFFPQLKLKDPGGNQGWARCGGQPCPALGKPENGFRGGDF
jgi:hypothetical protein